MNKEEIEKAKERCNSIVEFCKNNKECQKNKICSDCYIEIEDIFAIKTLLQYTDQLEQENKKQSKIIDEMAEYMSRIDMSEDICRNVSEEYCKKYKDCKPCIKQYFEKKVEEK